jgi:predicted dehydrogenase
MIKIGIIGAGYWGPNLIRNFTGIPDAEVKFIADKLPGRRKFVKAEFPAIQVVDDADTIINNKDVSVVIISTPVSSHFPLAEKALKAGKHVFIEKPFTNSVKKAEKLIELGEKKSLKIGVGHIFTFHSAIEYIYDFINITDGFKINYFISNRANLRPPKTKHDVIWDLAVHDFSIINYIFREFPVSIYTAACDCNCKGLNDMAVVILKYQNNKKVFDDMLGQKVQIFDEGIDTRINANEKSSKKFEYKPGVVLNPKIKNTQPLFKECRSFVDHIVNGSPYRNDGIQGLWTVKMCELAKESARQGKEIFFD